MINVMLCLVCMLIIIGKIFMKDVSMYKERLKRLKKIFIIILKIEVEKLY